ncbi:MAG TPA: DUF3226 domain-containing protein [Xanthobacteraceae bacterium]|jgi:hypothetical protein
MIGPKRVLLVEGLDDFHVCCSLFQRHKVPELFAVEPKMGVDKLLEALPVQLKASGIERVGVVLDADLNLGARWASLRAILSSAGYAVPEFPARTGTIVDEIGKPRLGVWLMPNNQLPGALEDFAALLIPASDALAVRANSVIEEIPAGERRFAQPHRAKAYIHTWLAWQEDPGTPMGLAITKKYLDATAEGAVEFLKWINALLIEP